MLFRIILAFAFFVFSLRAAEEEEIKNFAELSEKCERENALTSGEIQQVKSSKIVITSEYRVKCYFKCLLHEVNLVGNMDSNGNIIMEGLPAMKPENWKYIVECSNTTGIEPCDKALNFKNCMWTKKLADEKSN